MLIKNLALAVLLPCALAAPLPGKHTSMQPGNSVDSKLLRDVVGGAIGSTENTVKGTINGVEGGIEGIVESGPGGGVVGGVEGIFGGSVGYIGGVINSTIAQLKRGYAMATGGLPNNVESDKRDEDAVPAKEKQKKGILAVDVLNIDVTVSI